MILTIDVGNTKIKSTVFDGNKIIKHLINNKLTNDIIKSLMNLYPIDGVIISDVRKIKIDSVVDFLQSEGIKHYVLDHNAPIPFEIKYNPKTNLGLDRLAAMAGAYSIDATAKNYLIIDIGTCTTIDVISENVFIGGNISLGLQMRIDAMHHFTHALPQVEGVIPNTELGTNTEKAIQNGAYYGLIFEINQYINRYLDTYTPLLCVITGGGSEYKKKDDIPHSDIIFEPYLVDKGLNFIMQRMSKE